MYNIILMVSWQQEDKYIVKEKKHNLEGRKIEVAELGMITSDNWPPKWTQ